MKVFVEFVQSHRPSHSGRRTGRNQKSFPILSQKILVPETSAWTIQENESAHKFDLFRFGCNRNNCWRRDNESHRSGSDFRIGISRENRE